MGGNPLSGGGKSGGSTSNTTTSTSQPPQQVVDAYGALINRATQQSMTPYQSYQGQQVADLTPMQQQGFQNINNAQGTAQPYIDQASSLANQSAQPTWQNIPKYNDANLAAYQSPYQQNVIDTTMANINQNNAIQQQQLMGHAISSGASPFGGDRAGVAAAELARNQNLASGQTIAGLENQGFQNSQQQFNQQQQLQFQAQNADAQRQAQAANLQGNLGLASQGAALQGAQAQVQGGTLQQAQNQAQLNVPYQNFLQQQAYPYQQLGWLGNLTEGLGSNMGGQSITSSPGASSQSQMLGMGMFGAGALGSMMGNKDGGAIKYAKGGNVSVYNPEDIITWIPEGSLTLGHTIPNSPNIAQQSQSGGLGNMSSLMGMGSSLGKMMGGSGSGAAGSSGTDIGTSMPWLNGTGAAGNNADMGTSMPWLDSGSSGAMDYSSMGGYARGGAIPHYANGGLTIQPIDMYPPVFNGISPSASSNSNRDAQGNIISWVPQYPNESQSGPPAAGSTEAKKKSPWQGAATGAMSGASMGTAIMPGWGTAIGAVGGGLLGYFANSKDGGAAYNQGGLVPHYDDGGLIDDSEQDSPDSQDDTYQTAMEDIPAMGNTQQNAMQSAQSSIAPTASTTPGSQDITAANNPGLAIANANPQVEAPVQKPSYSQALMMAGLGTMAGNSPNTLQNIAQGGLQGFANYGQQKQAILAAQKEKQLEQHQQSMDNKPQIINDGKQYLAWYPHEKNSKTGQKGLAIPLGIPFSGSGVNEARIAMYNAQAEKAKNTQESGKFSMTPGMGQDENGNPTSGVYIFDQKKGDRPVFEQGIAVTPKNGAAAPTAALPRDANGAIDESKIPEDVKRQADAFVTGRAPYPSGMMLKQPLYQQALALAQEKDPKYDYITAPARLATYKKMTSGKSGDEFNALNTSLGHYSTLMDQWEKLHNTDYPIYNSIKNRGATAIGKKELKGFQQAADLLAPELIKAYGASHSVTETEKFKKNFDPSASPEQQQEVLKVGAHLMQSKIQSLQDSYERGMGTAEGFEKISKIGPAGVKTLEKLGLDTSKYNLGNPKSDSTAQTSKESLPTGIPAGSTLSATKSKGKDVYLTPDGKYLRVD